MQSTKFCALLLFSVIIVGFFALSPTFSSLMNSVVINSTGRISLFSRTAKSGSSLDIQTAVNAVVAIGGGTVYIPAGDFAFTPVNNGAVIINVPAGGINIIGAGIGVTILRSNIAPPNESVVFIDFKINANGHSFRVSGISFIGNVTDDNAQSTGIQETGGIDFRIDNCFFDSFTNEAIFCGYGASRGVIDHCNFDNTYKNNPSVAHIGYYFVWGYGIGVTGSQSSWVSNVSSLLGQYTITGPSEPVYIENCNFTRCRHAIDANGGGYYVSRYNYFQESAPYGQNDMHGGGAGAFGTRCIESYGNIFNFTDESYSGGQDYALEDRGGGGVFWNNTVIINTGYATHTVGLLNDGESSPYDVEQLYIWNNTAIWTNGTTFDFNSRISNAYGYTQNVNYFLRAPDLADDGFTYTPYTYPNPLTLGP